MFNSIFLKDGFSSLNRWWCDISHQIELKWITVTRFDAMDARSSQHDWPRHMSLLWHGICLSCVMLPKLEINKKKDGKSSRKRLRACSRRCEQQWTEEMKCDWLPAEIHWVAFWQSAVCVHAICYLRSVTWTLHIIALLGTPWFYRAVAAALSSPFMFLWNMESFSFFWLFPPITHHGSACLSLCPGPDRSHSHPGGGDVPSELHWRGHMQVEHTRWCLSASNAAQIPQQPLG